MWNEAVEKYVSQLVERCVSCRATSPPQPSRKVSITSLSQDLNDTVCVDHIFLDSVSIFHVMDLTTRYSAACVVPDTSMDSAVLALETCWISQFWMPTSIRADKAFVAGSFKAFCEGRDIKLSPVPPNRHNTNAIESKHGIIRSIFLKLTNAHPDLPKDLLAQRAVSISNDLYGNDTMSAFELAKGYTKPIDGQNVHKVPDEILDAQLRLAARRKLALILKSKATFENVVNVGDMVEVYNKTGIGKKGIWSTPKIVLSIDRDARSVVVPGKAGKRANVAIEDIRVAIPHDSFANTVQTAIDDLDDIIEQHTADISERDVADEASDMSIGEHFIQPTETIEHSDADFSGSGTSMHRDRPHTSNENPSTESISRGDRVQIFWPDDQKFYAGTVKHMHRDGFITVIYDDGERERLNFDNEIWRNESTTDSVCASSAQVDSVDLDLETVKDIEPMELKKMADYFGNKTFLKHQAQGFEQFVLHKAYDAEEAVFLKTVKIVPRGDVPNGANVINSHTVYKVKSNDDGSFKLKARIAPHGNEDALREQLSSDCATCPPVGLRLVESIASLKGWTLHKADVKSAFLQTGPAQRDVYVKPPRESGMKSTHFWLLLTAAYGLVNANAKWQVQSDTVFFDLGLNQCQQIPQIFYLHSGDELVLVVAKVVDDIKVAGKHDRAPKFITEFNKKFELGTVWSGPGQMRFFGLNLEQADDFTIRTDANDKLKNVDEYQLSRPRRKEFNDKLNEIEKSAFASANSSLGWIGIAVSPLCSLYASYLQQKAPDLLVCHLIEQVNILRKLKRIGTCMSYPRPTDNSQYVLTVLAFADASKSSENGQLGVLVGLLLGEMKMGSIFHPISWNSHKSKRPVKSVPAAEILATSEAIDESKMIAHAYMELLNLNVPVHVCVDSKDLFTSLSTQRNSIDRSIRSDVACIRHEFQVGNVDEISWIPGKLNLADVLTKPDSPLTDMLQLTLFTGRLQVDYSEESETKSTENNYG